MTRILLITTSYPNRGEGEAAAGAFVRDFALALHAQGAEVDVAAPADADCHNKESGVLVTRFCAPKLPLSLLNPAHPGDWAPIIKTLTAGRRTTMNICRERRPDHILALWALPSGSWARSAGERYRIPYSTWALGSDIWSLGKIPIIRHHLSRVMRSATHRFADGIQLSRDVTGICGKDCLFLPSSRRFGSNSTRNPSTQPPFRLAFLGRWHLNKGVDILFDALDRLSEQDWSHVSAIRIHGGGPLDAEVTRRCARLRESGYPVESGGYLDHRGARELFDWTDFIVIPSRIESIPVVFSDAMQAGRPVIATPVGDLPHLIHTYQCGLLAGQASPASLADTIRKALRGSPEAFLAGTRRAAVQFDITTAAQHLLNMIAR